MTRTRIAFYCLGFLLLILMGAGFYLYQNLPSLLSQQAGHYLQEYGVEDFEVERIQSSNVQLGIGRVWLRGRYAGFAYEATLTSLEINYNWRTLIAGRLQQVTLSELELVVEQVDNTTNAEPLILNLDSVLPLHLIADLPTQSLQIQQWGIHYRSPDIPQLSARGDLLVDENLLLHLETTVANATVKATLQAQDNPPEANLELALHKAEASIAHTSTQLRRIDKDEWEWQVQGQWQYTPLLELLGRLADEADPPQAIPALKELGLQGESSIVAHIRHPNELKLTAASWWPVAQQFEADIQLTSEIGKLDYPATIDSFEGTIDSSMKLSGGSFELIMQPTLLQGNVRAGRLSLPKDTLNWLRWNETVPVRWESTEPLKMTYDASNGSLQLLNTKLTLGDKESRLDLESLNLDATLVTGPQAQLSTRLSTSIKTRLRKHQLPQLELSLRQSGSLEQSAFDLQLTDTAESLAVGVEGNVDWRRGRGEYQISAQSLDLPYFADTVTPLLRKFDLLQQSQEIIAGTVQFEALWKSQDFKFVDRDQRSKLIVQGLSGSFEDYRFDGLALTANWKGLKQWKTEQAIKLSLAKLNLGFAVRDLRAEVSLPKYTPVAKPLVRFDVFTAGLFGGRLFMPEPHSWDFAAGSNRLTLRAQEWQLAEMVALQKDEDIRAQGVLEGELPVTMADGRIIIEKGFLRARPPGGRIQYAANEGSEALASSSPELKMTLDLLSDFQYQVLSSAVELDKKGNLLLDLSLSGHNPAWEDGRPVNFNINLQQNLDPLLQSLRLSDKLVEGIEGGLQ